MIAELVYIPVLQGIFEQMPRIKTDIFGNAGMFVVADHGK